jgi:uncharacterized protein
MKLADTNIFIYAVDEDSPHHEASKNWIESTLGSDDGLALAWLALAGFVRLSTKNGILRKSLTVADALGLVDDWLAHPNTRVLHPGERHADIFSRLLLVAGTGGNLTNDAHLAALAIEHHAELASFDRDFKRFSGLQFQLLT